MDLVQVALPEIRLINLLPTVPQIVDSDDDLAQLSYLNEPSVLHNLLCRYLQENTHSIEWQALYYFLSIRHYVNPFKNFQLYGDDAAYHALVAELKWIISDMTLCKRDVGVPAFGSTTT
ncbi:myosin-2-like [Salvia splendens]|uniref:myosin-2-like n=1 Tax=Salvia splendens TaxID=180675 RepID=UPI001C26A614|nr:myosin-2-like [Salvia splendens]